MLLTRRMERLGLDPLGFIANDYVIAVWALKNLGPTTLLAFSIGKCSVMTLRNGWLNQHC